MVVVDGDGRQRVVVDGEFAELDASHALDRVIWGWGDAVVAARTAAAVAAVGDEGGGTAVCNSCYSSQ